MFEIACGVTFRYSLMVLGKSNKEILSIQCPLSGTNLFNSWSRVVLQKPCLSASHEIPGVLWIPKFRYRVLKRPPKSEALCNISQHPSSLGRQVVSHEPNPQTREHPLLAVRDCSFNIFAATIYVWEPCPPSIVWARVTPWWQGDHSI
jgi:hypothetical protein